jgi:hypothetical protein
MGMRSAHPGRAGGAANLSTITQWLEEKERAGVKQVRVTSALAILRDAKQSARKARRRQNGKVEKHDLVGTSEAADNLGVEKPRIGRWSRRVCQECRGHCFVVSGQAVEYPPGDDEKNKCTCAKPHKHWSRVMPEPVAELRSGPVWYRSQIEAMTDERERRRRR